jgi:hypothetical protein
MVAKKSNSRRMGSHGNETFLRKHKAIANYNISHFIKEKQKMEKYMKS